MFEFVMGFILVALTLVLALRNLEGLRQGRPEASKGPTHLTPDRPSRRFVDNTDKFTVVMLLLFWAAALIIPLTTGG